MQFIFAPLSIFYSQIFQISLLLYANNRFNPYEWKRRNELGRATDSEAESFNFVGSMWFAFTTLTWQGKCNCSAIDVWNRRQLH